jgi:hypothetical protein
MDMLPQPDDATCGPTCLHAVYRYYGDHLPLSQVISEVVPLRGGGTLATYLAAHALLRGYRATLYTYNVKVFDPTWFAVRGISITDKLNAQLLYKVGDPDLAAATDGYLRFLELGGKLKFELLTASLVRRFLKKSVPILTGLNATYLYNCSRERVENGRLVYDDVRGEPVGHFVVLAGYDRESRQVLVADPLTPNPISRTATYRVNIYRLLSAILLGTLSYDDNMLIIQPPGRRR